MKEARLKAWKGEFILNNNGGKFDRTAQEVGDKASPEAFLATYDKLGGLILDKNGEKIPNGIFSERYMRWKEEQPKYIKTLERREQVLDDGEKRTVGLISMNIDHKRAFLGTLMTIAAAVIAGLFIFIANKDSNSCLNTLSTISSLGFALFIVGSSVYLTWILSQESISLDNRFKFLRESKRDFIKRISVDIVDIDSYEQYREQKYKEETESKTQGKMTNERYFVGICTLFVVSAILLLPMLISQSFNLCAITLR